MLRGETGEFDESFIEKHKHLVKKIKRKPENKMVEKEVDNKSADKELYCSYCENKFSTVGGRKRHENFCDENPEND